MFRIPFLLNRIALGYPQTFSKMIDRQSVTRKCLFFMQPQWQELMARTAGNLLGKNITSNSRCKLWACGALLAAYHRENSHALCAKKEDDLERQIRRILLLTTGDSEASIKTERVANLCANRDVVIVLGNSKASKSTVVNLLIGNKLKATLNKFKEYVIERDDGNDPSKGPLIGLKVGQPETSGPSAWNFSSKLQLPITDLIVDVPGFDDIRGPAQDIANAFCIHKILKKAKSVKVVLISDINDISHDSIKGFANLLTTVHTIFSGSAEVMDSASIIFSKCEPKHIGNIEQYLRVVLDNPDIKNGKTLVEHFLNTPKSIGVFKRPIKEGPIEISDAKEIAHVISEIKTVPLSTTKILPGISSDSQVFLEQALAQFTDPNQTASLINSVKTFCDSLIKDCKEAISSKNLARIREVKSTLLKIHEKFPKPVTDLVAAVSEERCLETLDSLGRMDSNISQTIRSSSVVSHIKLISFIDDLFGGGHSKGRWFNPINHALRYVDTQLKDHIDNASVALEQMTKAEAERKKKERDHANELIQKGLEQDLRAISQWENLVKSISALLISNDHSKAAVLLQETSRIFLDRDKEKAEKALDELKEKIRKIDREETSIG